MATIELLLLCEKKDDSLLLQPDKAGIDIFWLRDESLEESDNLPDPDVLAQEIVEDLEAALEQFREIVIDLSSQGMEERRTGPKGRLAWRPRAPV